MGSGLSTSSRAAVKLTNDKCYRTDSNRNQFKLEPVILSRGEVDGILEDDSHKVGTYILYEDLEKEKMYLAFKTSDKKIAHYAIVKMNDLYYFNDFPFPYLESIVLYYKKYKFKDTKLTNQAFLEPYLRTQQTKRKSSRSLISSSVDGLNNETIENDKTWTYGHYKSLSTRL
ncbi:uncharacterized protein LOC129971083 [Argiope bruennichi]|uniref:uncharacterized protein LOC129971083 n=1 Tax=Argiope bruennichi TaxID=94029 RepID=UPI0024941F2E|nr:uncharacterized protein LOC129971083 [Argiope bruennichi]